MRRLNSLCTSWRLKKQTPQSSTKRTSLNLFYRSAKNSNHPLRTQHRQAFVSGPPPRHLQEEIIRVFRSRLYQSDFGERANRSDGFAVVLREPRAPTAKRVHACPQMCLTAWSDTRHTRHVANIAGLLYRSTSTSPFPLPCCSIKSSEGRRGKWSDMTTPGPCVTAEITYMGSQRVVKAQPLRKLVYTG